jgi:hypothetical protein
MMPAIPASVVKVHDTRQYKDGGAAGYGSGDPSGVAYVPGLDVLFIADSEHDESPYYSSTNLFAVRPDGSFVRSYSLTSFTSEPTGLAYNPKNGYLYICDDDQNEVFWVDPANPSIKIGQFDTSIHGLTDTEDLKFDPVTGHMFILDGGSTLLNVGPKNARKLFELTDQGALVSSMTLPSVMRDAEALAYDPSHDVFFIASGVGPTIWGISRSGTILTTIDVLDSIGYRSWTLPSDGKLTLRTLKNSLIGVAPGPTGFELAPSSDPNDGDTLSLFVAVAGADQQHDGRLFEIGLGADWAGGGSDNYTSSIPMVGGTAVENSAFGMPVELLGGIFGFASMAMMAWIVLRRLRR